MSQHISSILTPIKPTSVALSSISHGTTSSSSQFRHTTLWNNVIANLTKKLIESALVDNSNTSVMQGNCDGNSTQSNTVNTNMSFFYSSSNHTRTSHPNFKLRKQHSRFVAASMVSGMLNIKENFTLNNANTATASTSISYPSTLSVLNLSKTPNKSRVNIEITANIHDSTTSHRNSPNIYFTGSQCVDIVFVYLSSNEHNHPFESVITREKTTKLCQRIMEAGVFEPANRTSIKFDDSSLKYYRLILTQQDRLLFNKMDQINENKENESSSPLKSSQISTTPVSKTADTSKKLSFNRSLNSAYRKSKTFNSNTTKNVKQRISSSMQTRGYRSKSCYSHYPNSNNGTIANTNTNDLKKLLEKKLNTNNQVNSSSSKTTLSKPFKKRSASHFTRNNNTRKEREEVSVKKDKLLQEKLYRRRLTREIVMEKLLTLIEMPILEPLLAIDYTNDLQCSNDDENSMIRILNESYDFSKCEINQEWRNSAEDCFKYLKSIQSAPLKDLNDLELYEEIKNYYSKQAYHKHQLFLENSFDSLLTNVLLLIRKSHYARALEILNLGSLLLLKQTQAELKRLLKFLYLTANSPNSPKLSTTKPNNSIVLNDFAECVINTKVTVIISFEESRLLLNFMLNNFDHLFKLDKCLKESIGKRLLILEKFGREEALIEKNYCKQFTARDYLKVSKEETTGALVDLINHIIDDPKISLKQKKKKLKMFEETHPDIYKKFFSDLN